MGRCSRNTTASVSAGPALQTIVVRGPSGASHQGLAEMLSARIEIELVIEREKEALLKRSPVLHERLRRLE